MKTEKDLSSADIDAARSLLLSGSIPEPNSGCWLWMKNVSGNGYGRLETSRHRGWLAHRLSAVALGGMSISGGMCVLHKCDVRVCVNPSHLMVGTQKDNVADMDRKGRRGRLAFGGADWARGERVSTARLTAEGVRDVRARLAAGEIHRTIAASLGVSLACVGHIASGKNWKWLK